VLGARVSGVDLSRPLDDADFTMLESALHEHAFIVIPGQGLDAASFAAFGRRWGRPEPHVIDTFHHREDPDILVLSNVVRDGRPTGLADAGSYFHSDYSYLDVPARCTILYALEMPRAKGGTTFANQTRAYEELPAETRLYIEPLVARHHYGNRDDLDEQSRTAASKLTPEQKKKVTWVRHKVARPHPRTGRKALYAVSGSSFAIEGMDDDEALDLLDALKAHSTQEKYRHTHEYQVGDVIVWDNAQLLHKAPLTDPNDPRTLWRITIKEK
jgi:taurine dioxygenase